jgi:alcohol dehydrogenase
VIARGSEKERAAIELGAHHYINTLDENASERLKNRWWILLWQRHRLQKRFQPFVRPGSTGKAILLGTGQTPLQVMPGMMIGAERTLTGSFRQHTAQTERALQFSHLFQTLPVTELLPFERANEALNRLKQGLARYRIVLTMNQDN